MVTIEVARITGIALAISCAWNARCALGMRRRAVLNAPRTPSLGIACGLNDAKIGGLAYRPRGMLVIPTCPLNTGPLSVVARCRWLLTGHALARIFRARTIFTICPTGDVLRRIAADSSHTLSGSRKRFERVAVDTDVRGGRVAYLREPLALSFHAEIVDRTRIPVVAGCRAVDPYEATLRVAAANIAHPLADALFADTCGIAADLRRAFTARKSNAVRWIPNAPGTGPEREGSQKTQTSCEKEHEETEFSPRKTPRKAAKSRHLSEDKANKTGFARSGFVSVNAQRLCPP